MISPGLFHRKISSLRLALVLAFLGLISCGIEVGNPHDDNGSNTTAMIPLTVALADAPIDNLAHIYLNIKGISLIVAGGNEILPLALTEAAVSPVDVLSLQDGLTAILVKDQSIPSAQYDGFIIELTAGTIGSAIESSGAAKTLSLPESEHNYLWISQRFSATAADQIVLHLDLRQSLRQRSDGSYQLVPVFNPVSTREATAMQGIVPGVTEGVICSYLQNLASDSTAPSNAMSGGGSDLRMFMANDGFGPAGGEPNFGGGLQRPPPDGNSHFARVPGTTSGARPSGGPRPDAGAPFGDCFISAPVHADGSFRFHFLRPGTYTLRYYPVSGTAVDVKGTFTVEPRPRDADATTPPAPLDVGTVTLQTTT